MKSLSEPFIYDKEDNRIEVVNGQQSVDNLTQDICSLVKAKIS